jgi:hypothetical protein
VWQDPRISARRPPGQPDRSKRAHLVWGFSRSSAR